VYDIEVVTPDQVSSLLIQEDKDLATLITCTPYGVNSHRIYVHGYRVPYEEGMEDEYERGILDFLKRNWWILLTVVLLGWLVFLLRRFNRTPKTDEDNETQGSNNDT
jgi:sortase A